MSLGRDWLVDGVGESVIVGCVEDEMGGDAVKWGCGLVSWRGAVEREMLAGFVIIGLVADHGMLQVRLNGPN